MCHIGAHNPRPKTGLGCSAFARRYLRNRVCFLFLWLLRCFSSPGSLPCRMHSGTGDPEGPGFPIRTSQDHRSVTNSPGLFAGSNVLHRLSTPRHSPHALIDFVTPTRPRPRDAVEQRTQPTSVKGNRIGLPNRGIQTAPAPIQQLRSARTNLLDKKPHLTALVAVSVSCRFAPAGSRLRPTADNDQIMTCQRTRRRCDRHRRCPRGEKPPHDAQSEG